MPNYQLHFYPDSVAGSFASKDTPAVSKYFLPDLEKIFELLENFPYPSLIAIYSGGNKRRLQFKKGDMIGSQKPIFHLTLTSDSEDNLAALALELSKQMRSSGSHFSIPFDLAMVVEAP